MKRSLNVSTDGLEILDKINTFSSQKANLAGIEFKSVHNVD